MPVQSVMWCNDDHLKPESDQMLSQIWRNSPDLNSKLLSVHPLNTFPHGVSDISHSWKDNVTLTFDLYAHIIVANIQQLTKTFIKIWHYDIYVLCQHANQLAMACPGPELLCMRCKHFPSPGSQSEAQAAQLTELTSWRQLQLAAVGCCSGEALPPICFEYGFDRWPVFTYCTSNHVIWICSSFPTRRNSLKAYWDIEFTRMGLSNYQKSEGVRTVGDGQDKIKLRCLALFAILQTLLRRLP